jgi:hypothetical protein
MSERSGLWLTSPVPTKLPGGDLNGDNQVNTLDYSILRFNWFTTNPVADITGDALTNLTDFNILKGNFYSAGDPQ